jgi:uncharacterized protein (AIM24 family)
VTVSDRAVACRWCGTVGDPAVSASCFRCGAPLGVITVADDSGWQELPAIPDAARIHFGQSMAEIEGSYVPMVEVGLGERDGLYFTHNMLLWKDAQVRIGNHPMKGAWKRMRGGLPLVMLEAHGPGSLGLSHDSAGELVTLPLDPGTSMVAAEHHLLAATTTARYDAVGSPLSFTYTRGSGTDSERETERPLGWFVDVFTADERPALVLLHARGNAFTRVLAAGEQVHCNPAALVAWAPTVTAQLQPEFTGSNQVLLMAHMTGPGLVITQSGAHGHVLRLSQSDIRRMAGGYGWGISW